jgi:hypothetical protein
MSTENQQKTSEIPGLNTDLPSETLPSTNDFTDFNSGTQANNAHENISNISQDLIDKAGEVWQEKLHKSPATKNKYGYWVKLRGRPLVKPIYVNDLKNSVDNSVGNDAENIKAQAKAVATNYAMGHMVVYGKDGYDEKLLFPLETALVQYMHARGVINIDPRWSVLIGAASYSFLVSQKPNNIEKTKRIFGGMWNGFKNWLFKNKKQPVVSTNVVAA